MTTGTVLAFIFTGITAPVAIVSGIWLESAAAAHRSAHSPAPAPPGGPAARRPSGRSAPPTPGPAHLPRPAPPVTAIGLRGPHQLGSGFPRAGRAWPYPADSHIRPS